MVLWTLSHMNILTFDICITHHYHHKLLGYNSKLEKILRIPTIGEKFARVVAMALPDLLLSG